MFLSILRAALFVILFGVPAQAFAAAPMATTSAASGITTSSAVLNGTGTPNGESTTGWFRYSSTNPGTCNDMFGTRVPALSGTDVGAGGFAVPYSITTTGLSPGVTYYFCAIVANASGSALGAVMSFTIPSLPVVLTTGTMSVTSGSATLLGSANPVAATTTGWFRYSATDPGICSDTFGSRAPSSSGSSLGSGTISVAFAQGIGGLTPGVTYYYCAIASNPYGTGLGAVLAFTTPAITPAVTTNSATNLTKTTGLLNGYANPGGAPTTGWFRYSTSNPGTCSDTFGTRAPATGGSALGSGISTAAFAQAVSGLSTATTYYYCAIAANSAGTGWGSVLTFITPAAPTATTSSVSYLTSTSVYLNGSGNPNRATATGWFRYSLTNPGTCDDKFGSRAPVTGGTYLGSDIGDASYGQSISGLSSGTTYYYCAVVGSSEGTAFGAVLSFITAGGSTATTAAATSVTTTTATLNGAGNPTGGNAYGWFRYSTTNPVACDDGFGTRAPTSSGTSLGSGSSSMAFAQGIGGLLPGTTYYYCAIVGNPYGTGYGAVLSFTTPVTLPVVTTNSATNLTRTTGLLNGYANPGGDTTTGWFRYGPGSPGTCNDTFGTRASATGGSALGAGTGTVAFTQAISGLSPATTYYYCALASNSGGLALGAVQTFITPSTPTATTLPISYLTSTSAYLNGSGNPNRASANGWFRYSLTSPGTCNDTFGSRAPITGGSYLGGDIGEVPYAQSITGLSSATTYYYCAIVSSTEGTALGAVLSFTTSSPAMATTSAAASVTSTTATLNGAGNPNGASASGWFRYSPTNPGTCDDVFGTRAPSSGGSSLGSGSASVAFAQGIGSLLPGATYYYCAIASNTYGTGLGAVLSFTTPVTLPVLTTSSATNLTRTTGLLNGYANPGGDVTTGWFRYSAGSPGSCNDTFGTRAPATGGSALGSGTSPVAFAQAISGLSPATTYYYCALASNSAGTAWGSVLSFITPAAPTATTTSTSYLTSSSANLNGSGNPYRAAAIGWFRYSVTNPGTCNDTFGVRAPVTSGTYLGGDIGEVPYSQSIAGLAGGTTYYYCAIVSSSEGTAFGAMLSFTTAAAATAQTMAATSVTATTATLNGAGNPSGGGASGWFRYSPTNPGACDDVFGTRTPSSGGSSLGSGSASVVFAQGISGLLPGATYYYCAIVSNPYGTGFGAVLTFTAPVQRPVVTTNGGTNLTRTTGLLNGYANPGGDTTTGWFRYSTSNPVTCTDAFGTRAPATGGSALGAGNSTVAFTQAITGLSPATTYYYCAIAANSVGQALGSVLTFITPAAPMATTLPSSSLTSTSAYLNGSGNPNRATANGWFRYSLTNPGTCNDTFGSRAPVTGGSYLGGDIGEVPYAQSITGLSSATTYYYCAIVSSSEGTAFGAVLSFFTASGATAQTAAATSVTATTVTLNGAGNPNGANASGWFRYNATDPGTCSDTFGTRAPTSSSSSLGSGSASVAFAQGISGLLPGATYYYCAIVTNPYGTGYGAVLTFTTPAMLPAVTTNGATNLTRTTGLLNGYANPGGDVTTGWFRYGTGSPGTCNDTFGTRAPATGGSALGAGTGTIPFTQAITGLSPATTYYYCAIAANSAGPAWGAVLTFVTPAAPTATTTSISYLTSSSAYLNGSGNPYRAAATGWFRYSVANPGSCNDTFGSRAPVSGGTYLGGDIGEVPYSQSISGLSGGTTYYYCAIVSSSEGTAFGVVLSFTTAGAATATTAAAASVTSATATLNGAGNPGGATAQGWFRYSPSNPGTCDDVFGTRSPSSGGTSLGSGSASVAFTQGIGGLLPGTTYYYCAIASNAYGTGLGAVLSFTTIVTTPAVTTNNATNLTRTTGLLNGYANPGGDTTTGWFRYSTGSPGTCNDTFGTRAPATGGSALGAGTSMIAYTQAITGLSPATTYYYCAIAANSVGMALGSVLTFITPAAPTATTLPISYLTSSSAYLNGSGNPNRATANGWFRYGLTSPGTCNDTFGSRAPVTGSTYLGGDIGEVPYSQSIAGLSGGTTYYYCAIVSSTEGTAFGAVLSFTTSGAAVVTTTAATTVTSTTATLNGAANPSGGSASGWFRYGTFNPGTCDDVFGTRAPTSSGTSLGSGSSSVAFAQGIAGLLPGATYYYCAIANNPYGTGFGLVLSFTTPASPPTVSTDSPSGIPIILNGSAIPNGASTIGWFRMATGSPGTCNDTFGTRVPTTGGAALGAGNSSVSYFNPAPGLVPGTTYYYCANASNALGTTFGSVRMFTAPMAPNVATLAATPVTATTAAINGSGNPNGNSTLGWFRYSPTNPITCSDAFGTRAPATGGTNLGAGTTATPFAESLASLTPATTYYFCAIVSSAVGTTFGAVLSFTTPPASSSPRAGSSAQPVPTGDPVVTKAASTLAADSAVLNATANPNGIATTGWFRYDTTDPGTCKDTFGTRAPVNGGAALGAGVGPVAYAQAVTGLLPGTTYYYCAMASSGGTTSFGAVLLLTTRAGPPRVTTAPPTDVAADAAVLNGSAIQTGDAATGWFRYSTINPGSCNDSFGVRAPQSGGQGLGDGVVAVSYSVALAGLLRDTTYYYCALAKSSLGTTFGQVVSFVPGADAPSVVTEVATAVDPTRATIAGTVDPSRSATTVWFRYGEVNPGACDDSFGSLALSTSDPGVVADTNVSPYVASLTGLKPNVTYYYCVAASNLGGAKFGQVRSFTTAAAPLLAGTVSSAVDAVKPQDLGGCSYRGGSGPIGSLPLLGTFLGLIGFLLFRRRRWG